MFKQSIFLLGLLPYFAWSQVNLPECDAADTRVAWKDKRVARMARVGGKIGCTATLIGKYCMISAGHCSSVFGEAFFNVPQSQPDGKPLRSSKSDTYLVDKSSISYAGDDLAFFKLQPKSGEKSPGEKYGYFSVSYDSPVVGEEVSLVGYGLSSQNTLNAAQKLATGTVAALFGDLWHGGMSYFDVFLPSSDGDSGSPIINKKGEILGTVSQGQCWGGAYITIADSIYKNSQEVKEIIERCLESEK